MAHVYNFKSYFYVELGQSSVATPHDLIQIRTQLNQWTNSLESPAVLQIELVDRASVMNYQPEKTKFLKIYVSLPRYVNMLRTAFEGNHFIYNHN